MIKKILITGPPRCGKSTLISKLIDYYKNEKNFVTYGFLTPEVKMEGTRIGFDILDIYSGNISPLARVGDFKTKYRVGKYSIFIEEFDNYIEEYLNLKDKRANLIIIDEIGKMELFSKKFLNFVKNIFSLEISILATIGLKLNHPIKDYLQNLLSVKFLNLNRQNVQTIFKKIVSLLN
ncbi:MAG: nucleoside-triphosphatase [Promethearchaeota archaeon]